MAATVILLCVHWYIKGINCCIYMFVYTHYSVHRHVYTIYTYLSIAVLGIAVCTVMHDCVISTLKVLLSIQPRQYCFHSRLGEWITCL